MNKYLCCNCTVEFDEPITLNPQSEADHGNTFDVCPKCHSTDFVPSIGNCSVCGRFIYKDETYYGIEKTAELICDDCCRVKN